MGTYKDSFLNLINKYQDEDLVEYVFYDFTNKRFDPKAQSRICRLSVQQDCSYNRDALLMLFTIGKNMDRVVIQSEGIRTVNPSSTYPQKVEALRLANENNWKYFALAVASEDFDDETIRDYIVSVESMSYAKATVCVIDEQISFLKNNNLPDFYRCRTTASDNMEYTLSFIKKKKLLDYIKLYDNHNESYFYCEKIKKHEIKNIASHRATNIIFFGVPGCGKSYHIEYNILGKNRETKEYNEYDKENIIRTTFYQDYTNTDFVGQILPKISTDASGKDIVEYVFNPGPFICALIQAIKNPQKKVALIIEEINRGNAPAIFGDIFQLLDRDENGTSEYGIINISVLDYLNTVNFGTEEEPLYYLFDEIKIPGNMDLFATMNTSDQNVYTLDTAFTRRWEKKRIENDFGTAAIKDKMVPQIACTWEKFITVINNQIKNHLEDLQVNEDKQVGAFFIKESDLLSEGEEDSPDKRKTYNFAYKVLEYLWDDVTKLEHTVIFSQGIKTFETLVKTFVKSGVVVFNKAVQDGLYDVGINNE